jgi:hypothetical protein
MADRLALAVVPGAGWSGDEIRAIARPCPQFSP